MGDRVEMGADIHGFWEVKDRHGIWTAVKPISNGRNYLWFSIVAGVRGKVPWDGDAEPWDRGMPDDASDMWKDFNQWGSENWMGLHNVTWLSLSEVCQANEMWFSSLRDHYEHEVIEEILSPESTDYEEVIDLDSTVDILYMGHGEDEEIRIPWCGTVGDMIATDDPTEECVRMVIAFDS
jgi:hypothetical protein